MSMSQVGSGLAPPKRTFLDSRPRIGSARQVSTVETADGSRPQTSQTLRERSTVVISPMPPTSSAQGCPKTTEAVLLVEHKGELTDILQESMTLLDNVYRTKQIFGEHLRFVDPSFCGDGVHRLNLLTPAAFDPSYSGSATRSDQVTLPQSALPSASPSNQPDLQRKLRTAEELIKKLFMKNTQLEAENKFFRDEVSRMEKICGISRSPATDLYVFDGHLPLNHPLFVPQMRRRCRSCPPSRTILRTAIGGYGVTVPPADAPSKHFSAFSAFGGEGPHDPFARQPRTDEDHNEDEVHNADKRSRGGNIDALTAAVQGMRKRIVQLTESLVVLTHENNRLHEEKGERVSYRDMLLTEYLSTRDRSLAQLRATLEEALSKVNNPMRLLRARQPNPGTNPAVAANNILQEVSQRLMSEITTLVDDMTLKSQSVLSGRPHNNAIADPEADSRVANFFHEDDEIPQGSNARAGSAGSNMRRNSGDTCEPRSPEDHHGSLPARRRELLSRLRPIVDALPHQKKKNLLYIMCELRHLFDCLVLSHRTLQTRFDDERRSAHREIVQLKVKTSVLADELRELQQHQPLL